MKNELPGISIKDGDDILKIEFADVVKYHGYNMIGGVALAYRILLWGIPQLTDQIPERGNFYFYSGIGPNGNGVIDTVEMILRVKTLDQLNVDKAWSMDKPGAYCPSGGNYYFELGYKAKKLCLGVKDGVVPDEFIRMSELAGKRTNQGLALEPEETEYLLKLRRELAEAIITSDPDDLFFVVSCE